MNLSLKNVDYFIPDGIALDEALSRTTHLVIASHQDDVELMALHAIGECYSSSSRWLTAVIVTDGGGSARTGRYKKYSDDEMKEVRKKEQRLAAKIGRYGLLIQLQRPSSAVKNKKTRAAISSDLVEITKLCKPNFAYLHNPMDKHDTHVATFLAAHSALRALPKKFQPKKVYGCEVWRDLDWLNDSEKVIFAVSKYWRLGIKLAQVFKSQLAGGKRYDLAIDGRRRAHATFFESHKVDCETHINFGVDLTDLVTKKNVSLKSWLKAKTHWLTSDVQRRVGRLTGLNA